jgi:hypothetical protein
MWKVKITVLISSSRFNINKKSNTYFAFHK